MRLLHADWDEVLLSGFAGILPSSWHLTSIRLSHEALPTENRGPWDVCVLGVSEHEVQGVFASLLVMARWDRPIVAWMSADAASWIPVLASFGASCFVSRSASADELRRMIVHAAAGELLTDPMLAAPSEDARARLRDAGLTPQQERVAMVYALHGSRRRVASDLCVSENTIKYHLRSVYKKTGTSRLHELQRLLRFGKQAARESGQARRAAAKSRARHPLE